MSQRLYFIRHGLSVSNQLGKLTGANDDTPLSPEGIIGAKQAGQSIKQLGLKLDAIVSSPMLRCIETAEIIAKEVKYPKDLIIVNDLFNERDFGRFEGMDYATTIVEEVEGVETVEQIKERAKRALSFLEQLKSAHNILVVSHGAFGRALRYHTQDYPYHDPPQFQNTKLVRLK